MIGAYRAAIGVDLRPGRFAASNRNLGAHDEEP
jgi:hypothetical protein